MPLRADEEDANAEKEAGDAWGARVGRFENSLVSHSRWPLLSASCASRFRMSWKERDRSLG